MKKLVLGIAGIIVLDLAFIVALTGESDDPTELAAIAPAPPVFHQSVQPEEPQTAITEPAPADEVELSVNAGSPAVRTRHTSRNIESTPVVESRGPLRGAAVEPEPAVFKDTVILYRGPERNDRLKELSGSTALVKAQPDEPVRKKRNVFSRALSVTKKPFDWVKSLASKL